MTGCPKRAHFAQKLIFQNKQLKYVTPLDFVHNSNSFRKISFLSFNPFPALIRSKYFLNFDYFCSIFISRRWSAVSVNHSIPPKSVLSQLQDGGGFVA